jgi:alpha-galactosidase
LSACSGWNESTGAANADAGSAAASGAISVGGASGSGGTAAGAGSAGTDSGPVLAPTPPMGWNSWNKLGTSVSEAAIKAMADAMVSSGMRDVGYQYINIDDTWSVKGDTTTGTTGRDLVTNQLVSDPMRFPSGIKALADYVHAQGLKLGIYGDRGTLTCGGYPGSNGYEALDAQTFADWGVDYLKYDNCSADGNTMQDDYTKMGNALKATGRPIVFSVCAWWFYNWEPNVGQLWRTTTDIKPNWDTIISLIDKNGGDTTRYGAFDNAMPISPSGAYDAPGLGQWAGPGHWNDPDMLEVGNSGLVDAEYRAHFALWAMMAAPLIAGNDLRTMNGTIQEILTNSDIIAVDQDPLGKQGAPLANSDTTLEVWSKPLTGSQTYAVALFNRGATSADITVNFADLGITSNAQLRDLSNHLDLGCKTSSYTGAAIASHGVLMLKVVADPSCTP